MTEKKERKPIEKLAFALAGIAGEIAKRAGALFGELEERGRLRAGDSEDYLRRVLERIRGEREDLNDVLLEIVRDASESAGLALSKDLEELRRKADKLSEKISEIERTGNT